MDFKDNIRDCNMHSSYKIGNSLGFDKYNNDNFNWLFYNENFC